MTVKKHPDYKDEIKRLDHTKEYIEMTLDATEKYRSEYKQNIKSAMEELDYLDSSQSYITVLVNSKFIEMADRNYDSLLKVRKKPYFARVDFKQEGKDDIDKLYIGKTSLMRAEDKVPLIVDWRSPIANIYYDGRLGEVSYETETGVERGEVLLKRQFTIEDGELNQILDIDITTTDAFLQASLDVNADNRLKDIASTIQSEQNKVIRAKMNKPLIVQGVAGSGKTTIALHRIAYLIYTYEKTFDPENFMIIAPNKLFINYISDVLPELGVEDVKQTTFDDFMIDLIGKKYKLVDTDDKLMALIDGNDLTPEERNLMVWISSFKGSLEFKDIIDGYIEDIEKKFIPEVDFKLDEFTIVPYEEIQNMFLNEMNYLPLNKRIPQIKKSLSNRLKYRKEEILKEIENIYDGKIEDIRYSMKESEERRLKLISLMDERDKKLENIKKVSKSALKKYLADFTKTTVFDYYKDLITNKDNISKYLHNDIPTKNLEYICSHSKKLLDKKRIEIEDCASIAYMKHKIFGFDKEIKVNSVVIDEAQDFSLFQFYVLKEILETSMFTILGDVSQGIHSYRGIKNWEEAITKVFGKETNYSTLVQSYRTTIEVMNLANEIIKKLDNKNTVLAKPVIRHGEKPELRSFSKEKELVNDLIIKVNEMKEKGYKSIAIVCKNVKECNSLKKSLEKAGNMEIQVINNKEENYEAGILIVPSHLAKGLEFDVVFIVNINENYEENELDIKLLYVAMTRALHQLFIYKINNTMPILKAINKEEYLKIQ